MESESEFNRQKDALWLKSEAEELKDRIGDLCEDHGSTNRTVAGIADAAQRASCEIQINRERRDHARRIRERQALLALHRAEQKARDAEWERSNREGDNDDDLPSANRFSTALPARKIMQRFNRPKKVTG